MIIEQIMEMVYRRRHDVMVKENRDVNLVIYIENDIWHKMMAELSGQLSPIAYDVYQNRGDRICGFPIYRVENSGHGIKVFES